MSLLAGVLLLAAASPAAAAEDRSRAFQIFEQVFDVMILRPLSGVATVVGVAPFLVSVPFLAPASDIGVSWDVFVAAPYDYTVTRELGDF